jgi:hypothetical protein
VKTFLLIALQLAASGSDAYFTHRNQSMPRHYENNPVAAPFVHSTRGQVAFFASGAAARIVVPTLLRKHWHPRLADAFAIEGIAENAAGAGFSATH